MLRSCSNKACTVINPQPITAFVKKPRYRDGIYPRCRTCTNVAAAAHRVKNPGRFKIAGKRHYWNSPEKQRKKSRNCRFRQKYWPHLTAKEAGAEWDKLYAQQEGRCSICKKLKWLDVEHCHTTLVVRSLACNGCNTALARIHEDIEIAEQLIAYIRKHKAC